MNPAPQQDQGEIICVLNRAAHSHAASQHRRSLIDACKANGREVRLLYLDDPRMEDEVRSAVEAGCPLVLAAGGDGTINAVASLLVGSQTALGVLPLGTLNHFAKDLGIPVDLPASVKAALTGSASPVDVGEVNGKLFLNNSSIGVYPSLVRQREFLQQKGLGKWLAFARALFSAFWRYPMISVQVETEGQQVTTLTPFVFVGNNRYELSAPRMGARTSLSRGQLWVCQAPQASRLRLLGFALFAMLGGASAKGAILFETKQLVIRSRRRHLAVATDGEVLQLKTPLCYQTRPGALLVMVPSATTS